MRKSLATFLKAIPAAVAGVLLITTATFAFNNLSTTGGSVSTVGGIPTLQGVTNVESVTTNSITASKFLADIGTAAAPSYAFSGNPTNGMYIDGSGVLSWSTAGVLRLTLTSAALRSSQALQPLSDNTIDIGSLATRWNDGFFGGVVSSTLFSTGAGTVAAPAYSFCGAGVCDMGMYIGTPGRISFATVGAERLQISVGSLKLGAGVILNPAVDNSQDIGTASLRFKDGYFGGTASSTNLIVANVSATTSVKLSGNSISGAGKGTCLVMTDTTDGSTKYYSSVAGVLTASANSCL